MNVQEQVSLKELNSFGVDNMAKWLIRVTHIDQVAEAFQFVKSNHLPYLILGGGSNLLFTRDFEGCVIKNELKGMSILCDDENEVIINVMAGENWHQFVNYCISHDFSGVENLALIPGTVGASPIQNIGAYGTEVKDVIHQVHAWHIDDQCMISLHHQECQFGYRDSIFKKALQNKVFITSIEYKLSKKPVFKINYGAIESELDKMGITQLSIRNIADAIIRIRTEKLPDPHIIGNAGSFFKNPMINNSELENLKAIYPSIPYYQLSHQMVKIPAAWLIEQNGWKGFRKGEVGCHEKQPLVLVNFGKAMGNEIFEFSEKIIQSVFEKFGIQLEREVNII